LVPSFLSWQPQHQDQIPYIGCRPAVVPPSRGRVVDSAIGAVATVTIGDRQLTEGCNDGVGGAGREVRWLCIPQPDSHDSGKA